MTRSASKRFAKRRTTSTPGQDATGQLTASSRRARKRAKKEAGKTAKDDHSRITARNAKRLIGVAKVVGPVLLPFAVKAVSAARDALDRMRARRLGVPADELGSFTGKGAALHARIAGDANALKDLRARGAGRTDEESIAIEQFADSAERRLVQLSSAVRAAERMPANRRRTAHHAVDGELSRIEDDLLRRFGV